MITRNLLSVFAVLSLFFLVSCGTGPASAKDEGASADTTAQMTEESSSSDNEGEAEDKSKRPSPLRQVSGAVGDVNIAMEYGSPSVKGRVIYGDLVPYNEVWRTGANEATTIEFSKDAQVEGKPIKAGKYGLFTIPGKDKWVIVFNSVWDQWGAYDYDQSKDVLRVEVKPMPLDQSVEALEFTIGDGQVVMKWAKLAVPFKIS